MRTPNIAIRDDASQMEEHLTNAIAFVLAKYRTPAGAAECLHEGRIGALLNVLAFEIARIPEDRRRERLISDLKDELQDRVATSLSSAPFDAVA